MPIPVQKDILLPFLQMIKDGEEHHINEVIDSLASNFKLTEEEEKQQYPSGNDNIFHNRVRFARAYLLRANLLESPKRGYIKISESGLKALQSGSFKFNTNISKQSRNQSLLGPNKKGEANGIDIQNPFDLLEDGYQTIRRSLSQEIIEYVKKCSPRFFEKLVVELLLKMGYGGFSADAGKVIGQSGDGGIDGIIKEDKLGLDVIYIQAKRWENPLGEPVIRDFVGSLVRNHANKGVIITPSYFTREAKEYVKNIPHRVILIDGESLAHYMIDSDIGVSKIVSYDVKKIDLDYFFEE
ncbi:MAG: restriction endonuclease [Patescibacteria group bacterium]|nr:restriction endonuclease [Patescibacteria group bacterium]